LMNMLKEERGISNMVAALILLSLALVGGAIVFGSMSSMTNVIVARADVQVQSSDIVVTSTRTIISVSVKNVGTVPLSSCTVTVYGDGATSVQISLGSIGVGKTASEENTVASGFTNGNTYAASLVAQTADGQTVRKAWSIIAR